MWGSGPQGHTLIPPMGRGQVTSIGPSQGQRGGGACGGPSGVAPPAAPAWHCGPCTRSQCHSLSFGPRPLLPHDGEAIVSNLNGQWGCQHCSSSLLPCHSQGLGGQAWWSGPVPESRGLGWMSETGLEPESGSLSSGPQQQSQNSKGKARDRVQVLKLESEPKYKNQVSKGGLRVPIPKSRGKARV